MPIKLPPGMSAATFATAIGEMQAAVGAEWVFTSEDDLETYRDAYSIRWGNDDEYLASAAVAPDTVEQVQAIVRIANEHKIPLYPISTGKNLGYGGSAPNVRGSVVVDLKRMNRILEVDDAATSRSSSRASPISISIATSRRRSSRSGSTRPIRAGAASIGNALDHGVGYTIGAFRDHFGAHCGMEVVLPSGEVMRTGMGAMPVARAGRTTSTASARTSTGSSARAISASSRRWASG